MGDENLSSSTFRTQGKRPGAVHLRREGLDLKVDLRIHKLGEPKRQSDITNVCDPRGKCRSRKRMLGGKVEVPGKKEGIG